MKRAYYSNKIDQFINDSVSSIIGKLSMNHSNRNLEELQTNAWIKQIEILKEQLKGLQGQIYFEFAIPRMGKRVDNIVIIGDTAFIMEFKVGERKYEKYAIEQVIDYTIDLKNFHEGSHNIKLIPILIATNAETVDNDYDEIINHNIAARCNRSNLNESIDFFVDTTANPININFWENSIYKPTPTIVEAAQALYKGHNVKEITRSDAGRINLSKTATCINKIVEQSKTTKSKSICFITGVPGAGKTLAGLNITNERMNADENEHAVFLSGNGPLVDVLREALARDLYTNFEEMIKPRESIINLIQSDKKIKEIDKLTLIKNINNGKINKEIAYKTAKAFIQNIHHFRDDNFQTDKAPIERVVIFDEAQRAWTEQQVSSFMKRKKGVENFNMSEPEFLINVMDHHEGWCTVICLIGGGQEINTGEAGLEAWIIALKKRFPNWKVFYSNRIIENSDYLKQEELKDWLKFSGKNEIDLHLAVSVRSFRSERVSDFIQEFLDLNMDRAKNIYQDLELSYPIFLTRNLESAKKWLKSKAKGTERTGILISSGAKRIRARGIDAENSLRSDSGSNTISNWFLNDKDDVRSSYFLEIAATEFVIQGLEIDWACVAWGANFYFTKDKWKYQNFRGSKWQSIHKESDKNYLKNAYRVLLTRARQGMVIYIPTGSDSDETRRHEFYDNTYYYLKGLGLKEIL